ncbi:SusC/RagA family TonB-linked outer membrane protein [uncultured Draconibacterium sp.]|uniref:SusC/RagA family TonB-linked outer membrane protein n=1 Tax=uncultured Draconibacterium sp. TaxID=1573823 RepID=UPI002AA6D99F|nr:SusC/RagA family TonB-linked outer membrane protein [uncultured Draconibacterium sp.]
MRKYINKIVLLVTAVLASFGVWAQNDSLEVTEVNRTADVNIAYGIQTKSNVSSSMSTVSGEELSKGAVSNFGNTLYGKLAGLSVIQGGGEPGYNSPTLRIRGANADPLVMIDGFERDLTYLNPEEVESVSVLKDAAAVALYGMKAANGAILITTKRGKIEKNRIDISVQSGLQSPTNTVGILGSRDYMTLYNQAAINDGLSAKYSDADISAAGTSPLYPDVDWYDQVVKNSSNISRANVGIQGGSDFIQYFVNVGFLYNNGIYKPENPDMKANANLTQLNLRSNIDINISKTTRFSMDLSGMMNNNTFPANSASEIWTALLTLPPNAFNVTNPNGSYGGTSLLNNNPYAMIEYGGRNSSVTNFLNAGFTLTQQFDFVAEGLAAGISYVLDNGSVNSDGNWRYFPYSQIASGSNGEYSYYSYREDSPYNVWSNASSTRNNVFSANITYDMVSESDNDLSVLLRYQGDKEYRENTDLSPYLTNNYAARVQYAYANKYLLEASVSYFGSDQYADGDQYGFFPSVSAGWVFSNEDYVGEESAINFGKLRASYGITGLNRYVNGRYPFRQFYNDGGSFPIGTGWDMIYGIKPGMLANSDIQWEISKKLNIGIDLEMFDHLTFAFDYFQDKRSDVLYIDYNHSSATGAELPYENIGKLTNSGFEVELGYSSQENELKWFSNLVISYFDNTIDEMGESLNGSDLAHLNKTGNSVSTVYGYEVVGTFASESDIQSSPTQTFGTPRVGDLKYADLNNDQVIDSRDMTAIGDNIGNVDVGLNLGFEYKGFDMEAMLQGQFNREIVLSDNVLYQPFLTGNAATEIVNESDFPALSLTNTNNYQASSYWVRKGDFIKLRNIELGYSLSENITNRLGMERVRFFVRGVNVLTLSDWDYTDPEYIGIGYPPMTSYFLGLNLNF